MSDSNLYQIYDSNHSKISDSLTQWCSNHGPRGPHVDR